MTLLLLFEQFGLKLVNDAFELIGLLVFLGKETVHLPLQIAVLAKELLG